MGNLFQDDVGKTSYCRCSFWLLWLRKLAKVMKKDLEMKSGINWNFNYESKGNQEKMKVKGHKFHVKRKLKENNGK